MKYELEKLRINAGFSREYVSQKTFIDLMTLYQFEKHNSIPNIIDAQILAAFYNKNINQINWNKKLKKGD